jgi:hypothetical protein
MMPSQTGQQIVDSIKEVAASADKTAAAGSLGVKGWILTNIVQLTAAGSFLYIGTLVLDEWKTQSAAMRKQSEDDRALFREEMKAQRDSADKKYDKTELTHGKAMEKMGATIERSVTAMESSTTAMRAVSAEMKDLGKELKDAVRMVGKVGNPKGPGG